MVSLLISLNNILFGSLIVLTIDRGRASNNRKMRTICQNIFLCGAAAIAFSGCSIVVFEDGSDCPAATVCEVLELSDLGQLDEVPSSAPAAEQPEIIAPEISVPKTKDFFIFTSF